MTLHDACEFGILFGLETTGEAVNNIARNAPSLFAYDRIRVELEELYDELSTYDGDEYIFKLFPDLREEVVF